MSQQSKERRRERKDETSRLLKEMDEDRKFEPRDPRDLLDYGGYTDHQPKSPNGA